MLPTMRTKLATDCVILLDDANRPAERELVRSWSDELGGSAEIDPSRRGLAKLSLGDHSPRA